MIRLIRAVRIAAPSVLLVALVACSDQPESCTMELGIHIDPREATLRVGQELRPDVETSTCGGSVRGKPAGLAFEARDPEIASVEGTVIVGIAPGTTTIDVRSTVHDHLGVIVVRVRP